MTVREAVRWEKKGRVAHVWLCNPKKRNAMGPAFWAELPEVMAEISRDDELAAVALMGEGPAFTVGLDIKAMMGVLTPSESQIETRRRLLSEIRRMQDSISSVAVCPIPVVAAMHGYCLGGGVDLVSACDVRIASQDLVLSVREIKLAMVADVGTLQRLPRLIGHGHVAELAFTGKDIGAERCRQIGLVNDVYDTSEKAIAAAHTMAAEMAENSPFVLRGVKKVLQYSADHTLQEGLEYVAMHNTSFLMSEDLGEAMQAFIEKRPARFRGR
ncbi:MAG: crotonase/enoyl-CoA hydratase family protein [Polyangiaceae bacterium]